MHVKGAGAVNVRAFHSRREIREIDAKPFSRVLTLERDALSPFDLSYVEACRQGHLCIEQSGFFWVKMLLFF